jgi:hypothetical protein
LLSNWLKKKQTENLTNDIRKSDGLYSYQNTLDGLPVSKVLPDWMNNVVEAENLKQQLKLWIVKVMTSKKNMLNMLQRSYYKRIEREITVSEQGYLEILHGLNLAKLQDSEMSSNIKLLMSHFSIIT